MHKIVTKTRLYLSEGDQHVEHHVAGEDVRVVQTALHVVKSLDQLRTGVFLPTFAKVGEKLLLHVNLGLNLEVFQEVLELGHEADAHVLDVVRNDESSRSMVNVPLIGNEVVAGARQF